jgi:archaeosine-15-forming tRNA-guanine transglycosylase
MSNNELQNDDFILPGNLGCIRVEHGKAEIIQQFRSNDGAVTLTLLPIQMTCEQIDENTMQVIIERTIIKH